MAAWQTLEFMLLGKAKHESSRKGHQRNIESVDLGSEITYPRGSFDDDNRSVHEDKDEEESDSLQKKWRKLKAKLKRTASKKSLKSVKSMKSGKNTGDA